MPEDRAQSAARRELADRIASLPGRLESFVAALSAEQLTSRYLPEEWTLAQNVHHLADAHMVLWLRVKLTLTEDRPTLMLYNQDRFAQLAEAAGAAIAPSLAIIRAVHERCLALLPSLSEDDWRRVGVHPVRGEMTVEDMVRLWANHGDAHYAQMEKTLAAGK